MRWLKSLVKRAVARMGYRLMRGGLRVGMDEALRQAVGAGVKPATVIDVGVAYGTPELLRWFPAARHLLVEPLEEYRPVLEAAARTHRAEYILAAAGERPGTLTLNVHPDLSGSSLYRESDGGGADGTPREVPVVTLDDACRERGLTGPFVLKVDAQGAELAVLAGAEGILRETQYLMVEANLFQFFVGGPQLHDLLAHLKARGFVVYDIYGGNCRPLDDALAQVDLAFVREDGPLRSQHGYATAEQRRRLLDEWRRAHPGP